MYNAYLTDLLVEQRYLMGVNYYVGDRSETVSHEIMRLYGELPIGVIMASYDKYLELTRPK